jgi:hypothetical protein
MTKNIFYVVDPFVLSNQKCRFPWIAAPQYSDELKKRSVSVSAKRTNSCIEWNETDAGACLVDNAALRSSRTTLTAADATEFETLHTHRSWQPTLGSWTC